MKIDIKARFKNYMFYIGLIGVILTATGVNFEELTSWNLLINAFIDILKNPVALVSSFMAIGGIITDTSTVGIGDKE